MASASRPATYAKPRSRQSSVTSSQENLLDRKFTLTRKNSTGIPSLFSSPPKTADGKLLILIANSQLQLCLKWFDLKVAWQSCFLLAMTDSFPPEKRDDLNYFSKSFS